MRTDEEMMGMCLTLAREAAARGDHPFGCVIVDGEGDIISTGRNQEMTRCDLTWHSEIEALREAQKYAQSPDLSEYTLYTNGEPCLMCATVIRRAQIRRVVIGAPSKGSVHVNPHPLRDQVFSNTPAPELVEGVLLNDCLRVQGREAEICGE